MAPLTPMMKQYFEIKDLYKDCLLFYRLGDFYEMFYDDAVIASRELELTLTGRDCGQAERAPMCGVPYHSYEAYLARLVKKGYKVAICEQMEDPALAKGLVKRAVTRVVTPGTVIEGSMLEEGRNNYLCVIFLADGAADAGLSFTDCSTGEMHVTTISGEDILLRVTNEISRFNPSEILLNDAAYAHEELMRFINDRITARVELADAADFDYTRAEDRIIRHFHKSTLLDVGLDGQYCAVRALGCALAYLYETQMNGLERIDVLDVYSDARFMKLDLTARRNLELVETMRQKSKRGSLLGVLDHTATAMGKRLIRTWLEQPLINPAMITRRQNAVDELFGDTILCGDLMELLKDVYDLERIMTRVVYGSANAKELVTLGQTICALGPIRQRMAGVKSLMLQEILQDIDPLEDVRDLIGRAIRDDPPITVREGDIIRDGYSEELDAIRLDKSDGQGIITRLETEERGRTGIKNLKVRYNRVFGYYIEISHAYTGEIPENYIRKQTLANAERYITPELKEVERRVLGANDRIVALEYKLFTEVRETIARELTRVQTTARAVARLDVLCSMADVAIKHNYSRPLIDMKGRIEIKHGRHPVVEALLDAPFVPNDTLLDLSLIHI